MKAQKPTGRAWLIERSTRTVPIYLSAVRDVIGVAPRTDCEWSADSLLAIRFARQEDAEHLIAGLGLGGAVATEHQWGEPADGEMPVLRPLSLVSDWTLRAMELWGGSFVRALEEAWCRADGDNRRRLLEAFPEYWSDYAKKGRLLREREEYKKTAEREEVGRAEGAEPEHEETVIPLEPSEYDPLANRGRGGTV